MITGNMAKGVIDFFEEIDIDKHGPYGLIGAILNKLFTIIDKVAFTADTGETVG
jgi:hypothetical protein